MEVDDDEEDDDLGGVLNDEDESIEEELSAEVPVNSDVVGSDEK